MVASKDAVNAYKITAISEQIKEMGLVRKPFVPSKYTDSPY